MQKSFLIICLSLSVFTLMLSGCKTTGGKGDDVDVVDSTGAADDDATTYGAGTDSGITGSSSGTGSSDAISSDLLDNTTFYFDYDQSLVKPEARSSLSSHAKYLRQNANARILLEGHADENGTREYNLALGERRAEAVRRYLTVQGVSPGQIDTVSYGEEKPVAFGHGENSWWQNRRVELVYKRQ